MAMEESMDKLIASLAMYLKDPAKTEQLYFTEELL